ncbi:DUF58 domain-containing protein [Bellilinea sp.]|uniref:DUF58 domain-containing protein n=1 Tax=Bellilinea sp. TaxID=2838785 RepID=UPI002ADD8464|nr:DUF58 domain-containing protein [Bellilinea sp.]
MKIRPPFFVFLALLAGSFAGAYLTQQPTVFVYYRIIYLLLALLTIAFLWAVLALRGLTATRNARVLRLPVGQIFEERFEVRNESWYGRLWIEVKDLSPLPEKQGSRVISGIGPHQLRSYFSRTLLIQRGAFRLGPTVLISGDPFGFFAVNKVIPSEKTLLVFPYMVNLQKFPEPGGELPGGRALRRKSLEVTPYAAGVREYAPGDPLNRIHWKTTARKDRLMVKEFEQDPQADVWLLLDAQAGTHSALADIRRVDRANHYWIIPQKLVIPLPPNSFEYGVSCAASVADYYLKRGRSVGFACAAQTLSVLPAEKGVRQMGKLLETLAFLQPEGNLSLVGLIEGQANQIPKGSTVVLITALCSELLELAIEMLLRKDLRPVVIGLDVVSFGAPPKDCGVFERLRAYGIPVRIIRNGDDLQNSLENDQI